MGMAGIYTEVAGATMPLLLEAEGRRGTWWLVQLQMIRKVRNAELLKLINTIGFYEKKGTNLYCAATSGYNTPTAWLTGQSYLCTCVV